MSRPLQRSLFEHDYLIRTLGTLASIPDVALTELVANAWDAGATRVDIVLPTEAEGVLSVCDDGCGMSLKEFKQRWMTLGYDRSRRQGGQAEFPPERQEWKRRAYGRNGVGRHGMLCFADEYVVETSRDGSAHAFRVAAVSGHEPFALIAQEEMEPWGHGTRLVASANRNVPQVSRIRDVLAGRFLHDPQFAVFVNGETVDLSKHEGLVDQGTIACAQGITLEVFAIDSTKTARRMRHHGIAFWVGSRLVGEPSWIVGDRALADGRTALAKRHTIVVRTQDLFDEVEPDWSGFKKTDLVKQVQSVVADYVETLIGRLMAGRIGDTKEAVLRQHRSDLSTLRPLARLEVQEFVDAVITRQPTVQPEHLTAAVQALINLEKTRSGVALLQKLSQFDESDVEGLNRLLEEWTVRDALTVLDEIDKRIAVIEALERLSGDKAVDELKTLHPLVTQARWLFGPEFDSPLYSTNVSLRKAIQKVFKKRASDETFLNARKRPDIMILKDATISAVGSDSIADNGLNSMRDVLIIELKRGDSEIGRDQMDQGGGYVEDLLNCGFLDGRPYIRAFVVGERLAPKVTSTRRIGEHPEVGRVEACTFSQLVRTAEKRLFRLREELAARYSDVGTAALLGRSDERVEQLEAMPSESGAA